MGFMAPLIGGLILIMLGSMFYLHVMGITETRVLWALFFIMIGVVIIVGSVYGALMAARRHPKT